MNYVNSQTARRIIDRLIGYSISGITMKEVQSGLRSLNSYIEVFEGSYSELSTYIDRNYPQSKIHFNHSTDTSYFRNQISKFKNKTK